MMTFNSTLVGLINFSLAGQLFYSCFLHYYIKLTVICNIWVCYTVSLLYMQVLKAEINSLRRLLRDANMTLSLWIRARQASEPNSQLPPMIRGPNVSFVNFPVTKSIE